jgi:hypothetical protein
MKENDAPMADENQVFCSLAAENGHLEVLKWLREIGMEWGYYTGIKAILSKNQEMIKWLQEVGYPFGKVESERLIIELEQPPLPQIEIFCTLPVQRY